MTPDEREAWRQKAQAATPGPWKAARSSPFVEPDRVEAAEEVVVYADLITADADYIAYSHPVRVLALLAERDALAAALRHIRKQITSRHPGYAGDHLLWTVQFNEASIAEIDAALRAPVAAPSEVPPND